MVMINEEQSQFDKISDEKKKTAVQIQSDLNDLFKVGLGN
jgi:hypothetical protein